MIIDERTDYCGLEKSQNVFVIAFDFLRKLFYSSIKWLADIVWIYICVILISSDKAQINNTFDFKLKINKLKYSIGKEKGLSQNEKEFYFSFVNKLENNWY